MEKRSAGRGANTKCTATSAGASTERGRHHGVPGEVLGEQETLPNRLGGPERMTEAVRESGEHLSRAPGTALRIEPGLYPGDRRSAAEHLDRGKERSEVVGDVPPAFLAHPLDARLSQEGFCGASDRVGARVVVGGEGHAVVRADDRPAQRRRAEPHVAQLDERAAVRQRGLDGLPHLPGRKPLGEEEVGELALSGHPEGQRRAKRKGAAGSPPAPGGQRQARGDQPFEPLRNEVAGGFRVVAGLAPERKPPALARFAAGGRSPVARAGITLHVW